MKTVLKRIAVRTLAPLGTFHIARRLMPLAKGAIPILAYHRVMPLKNDAAHQGDVELVSATPEEFLWQMKYVARHFTPVTFSQIADAFDKVAPLPRRPIAVSFDDAFADLYHYAFPIMKEARVTATVFAPTGYVDNRRPMWFDQLAFVLMEVPVGSVTLGLDRPKLPTEESFGARKFAIYTVLRHLKDVSEDEREHFVGRLFDCFADTVERSAGLLGRALTWEQMREMSTAGIEFGSHTVSHRNLGQLSADDVRLELLESKQRLEQELGKSICSIAYPFGGRNAFSGEIVRQVSEAGYRIGTSYLPGLNFVGKTDRFSLHRQHVERYTSRADFQALVSFPEIFR